MYRTLLLGAVSAVALACISTASFAQESTTAITGGGSTLAEFDYFAEFAAFNAAQASGAAIFANPTPPNATSANTAQESLYWASGSGSGQSAFLNDDLTCDSNKVLGLNGKNCSGLTFGGANAVDYGASDATLSSSQIAGWATSAYGQSAAGNLIQLPSMGVGIAFPVVDTVSTNVTTKSGGKTTTTVHTTAMTASGQFTLDDNDLCGIFSGKLTNWNQTDAYAYGTASNVKAGTYYPTAGAITVVVRSDGSGTSFLLLNHLARVCTATNSSFNLPITPSTTFATVFPNSTLPSNFSAQNGSSGVASFLANATVPAPTTPVTSAIGYVSPDFTNIGFVSPAASLAKLANGAAPSTLYVAAAGTNGKGILPTEANVATALNHAVIGQNLTAPTTAAQAANPTSWVPLIQTVSAGYPVVGYTTFDFAQCYASPVVAQGIINFLTAHYNASNNYAAIIEANTFVPIAASGAKVFSTAITQDILTNTKHGSGKTAAGFYTDIQDSVKCKGLAGR